MKQLLFLLCLGAMALHSHAQIANPDFEAWDTAMDAHLYPHDWPLLANNYCTRSENAQQGNYALTVSVWYYYTKTNAVQVSPISYKPAAFSGYYTYTDNVVREQATGDTLADTAFVSVFLTRWNNTLQQEDTVGKGSLPLFESATFAGFTCPVTYTDTAMPDSVTLFFDPSIVRRYENATLFQSTSNMGRSSFLTIDNLSLQADPAAVAAVKGNNSLLLFPNPVNDQLTVNLPGAGSYTLVISDAMGRICNRISVTGSSNTVSVAKLPKGTYEVQLYDAGNSRLFSGRFIKL